MHANLLADGGLMMAESLTLALAPTLGRAEAHQLAQKLCQLSTTSGTTLQEITLADQQVRAVLSEDAIERALDPASYLGSADALIDRALAAYRELAENG